MKCLRTIWNEPNSSLKLLSKMCDKPALGQLPEWEASLHATPHVSRRASEETPPARMWVCALRPRLSTGSGGTSSSSLSEEPQTT